jgi:hypothetical protein
MKQFSEMTEIEAAEHYGNIGASHALSRLGQELEILRDDILGPDEVKAGFRAGMNHVIQMCEKQSFAFVSHLPHAQEAKAANDRVKATINNEKENN